MVPFVLQARSQSKWMASSGPTMKVLILLVSLGVAVVFGQQFPSFLPPTLGTGATNANQYYPYFDPYGTGGGSKGGRSKKGGKSKANNYYNPYDPYGYYNPYGYGSKSKGGRSKGRGSKGGKSQQQAYNPYYNPYAGFPG